MQQLLLTVDHNCLVRFWWFLLLVVNTDFAGVHEYIVLGDLKQENKQGKKKKRVAEKIIITLRAGFEPARGDPIGFQVQRLNHSAITAHMQQRLIFEFYEHNILVRG